MKYNFENKYLTASTDSTAVAKRLILIIEDMEKLEEENKDPVLKSYLGEMPDQPFKGAIVVDEPEQPIVNPQTKREFAEIMANRIKKTEKEQDPDDIELDDEPEHRVPVQIDTGKDISSVPDTTGKYQAEKHYSKKVKASEIIPAEGTVEEAYMGEHFEVVPDEPAEQPLTPAENELWEYIQKNPQYTMASACRDLNITTANYYWRKRQLFLKGRKVGGTIAFAKKSEE